MKLLKLLVLMLLPVLLFAQDPYRDRGVVRVRPVSGSGYDSTATTIVLYPGDGSYLPTPSTDSSFNLIWWDATERPGGGLKYSYPALDPNFEVIRVRNRSGDTLKNVLRGQARTSAKNHNVSGGKWLMAMAFSEKTLNDLLAHVGTGGGSGDTSFKARVYGYSTFGDSILFIAGDGVSLIYSNHQVLISIDTARVSTISDNNDLYTSIIANVLGRYSASRIIDSLNLDNRTITKKWNFTDHAKFTDVNISNNSKALYTNDTGNVVGLSIPSATKLLGSMVGNLMRYYTIAGTGSASISFSNDTIYVHADTGTGGGGTAGVSALQNSDGTITLSSSTGNITISVPSLGIGTSQLANLAVTLGKLASNSVDSNKIIDGSVATSDFSSSAKAPLSVMSDSAKAVRQHYHVIGDLLSGILNVANGGTGLNTIATYGIPYGNGTGAMSVLTIGTAHYVMRVNNAGTGYIYSLLDSLSIGTGAIAGSNISSNAIDSAKIKAGQITTSKFSATAKAPYATLADSSKSGGVASVSWAGDLTGSGSSPTIASNKITLDKIDPSIRIKVGGYTGMIAVWYAIDSIGHYPVGYSMFDTTGAYHFITNTQAANASLLTSGTLPDARLTNTGVTARSYTNLNAIIDAHGRITWAADGVSGGGGGSGSTYQGVDSFATSGTRKAVYIPGNRSYYIANVTPKAVSFSTLPVAADFSNGFCKADSLIVQRAAGTTSNLNFYYTISTDSLAPVTGLTKSYTTASSIAGSWAIPVNNSYTNATTVDSLVVAVDTGTISNPTMALFKKVVARTVTTDSITGLTGNTPYKFYVFSRTWDGFYSSSSVVVCSTTVSAGTQYQFDTVGTTLGWWRAQDNPTPAGGILDHSSSGHNLDTTSRYWLAGNYLYDGSYPTYISNANNSLPAINIATGAYCGLYNDAIGTALSGSDKKFTLFMVVKFNDTTTSPTHTIFNIQNGTASAGRMQLWMGTTNGANRFGGFYYANYPQESTTPNASLGESPTAYFTGGMANYHLMSAAYNETTDSILVRWDGTTILRDTTGGVGAFTTTKFILNRSATLAGDGAEICGLAFQEMIIYSDWFTTAKYLWMEGSNGLRGKYATPHP